MKPSSCNRDRLDRSPVDLAVLGTGRRQNSPWSLQYLSSHAGRQDGLTHWPGVAPGSLPRFAGGPRLPRARRPLSSAVL